MRQLRIEKAIAVTIGGVLVVLAAGCGGDNPAGPGDNSGGTTALQLEMFQAADLVIGQPDLTSDLPDAGGSVGALGLDGPQSGGDGDGPFYVADRRNHRVLGFDGVPDTDGVPASFVIGQPDFTSNGSGVAADRLDSPSDCCVSGGKLIVSDYNNNRVLIWNSLPTSDVPADVVVGQPDFTSNAFGTSRTALFSPFRVAVANGRLFVGDGENNRVLIWNAVPTTNGAPADLVIGQPDFTSNGSALSASGLDAPLGFWTDGHRLAVGDAGNRRVLIWSSIPTTNGAPADVVLGAPDFVTQGEGTASATSVRFANGIDSDGTSLFIADEKDHRVLVFTPFPTTNGTAATLVLGQSDFVHSAPNDANQDGTSDPHPTARTFSDPRDVRVMGDRLLVADELNHRILVFGSGSR